jgi:hypothetical protein
LQDQNNEPLTAPTKIGELVLNSKVILSAVALLVYIYQIDLIYKIDFSMLVLVIQKKLNKLKVSTLNVTRILFLQLLVWTTFYWNKTMFENGNVTLWVIQGIITLLSVYFSFSLFFNIKYENRDKKWFKLIFNGQEWIPLMKSMEVLEKVEDYKNE